MVRLEAGSLSLREKQLRFIVRGTEGGWIKVSYCVLFIVGSDNMLKTTSIILTHKKIS